MVLEGSRGKRAACRCLSARPTIIRRLCGQIYKKRVFSLSLYSTLLPYFRYNSRKMLIFTLFGKVFFVLSECCAPPLRFLSGKHAKTELEQPPWDGDAEPAETRGSKTQKAIPARRLTRGKRRDGMALPGGRNNMVCQGKEANRA